MQLLTNKRQAVVYLARKLDAMQWMPRFLSTLQTNPSGMPYDLIVVLKGYREDERPACLRAFAAPGLEQVLTMTFDDRRFATEAFFAAAERFDHDAFLFFVSSARVLGPNWAEHMFLPLHKEKASLVGASSGFESLNQDTPYPNPSIRTNGFAMRRDDWLSLARGDLSIRYGGNLFEAGPESMTKQILQSKGTVFLIDSDGRTFPPEAWHKSATFRLQQQQKLLFADKRTDEFKLARPSKRRRLAHLNWGAEVPVVTANSCVVYLARARSLAASLYWRTLGYWIIRRRG